MNTNPPRVDEPLTGDELKIIHIDPILKVGLVKSDNMKYSQHVELQDWLIDGIKLLDYVTVKKTVEGKLIVVNYHVNPEMYSDEVYSNEVLI